LQPSEQPGVVAGGVFYAHTPHFLETKKEGRHAEATDERIVFVLENPEQVVLLQGDRRVYWARILDPGVEPWWMRVVVVENRSGPAILSEYGPPDAG
jgi:hypothetical protein